MGELGYRHSATSPAAETEEAAFLTDWVGDRERLPYAHLAAQLGESEGAVQVAVHRLRQRYRDLLRAEISHTVASASEVDAEMPHLCKVLAQGEP